MTTKIINMNLEALKHTIKLAIFDQTIFFYFIFLAIIISFILSFYISNDFYLLLIPLLLLFGYSLFLILPEEYDNYLRYCRNENFMSNGSHTIKKENGKYIVNLLNGKRHGSFVKYFINGQIKLECNYKNGEIGGAYKLYYENGQIEKNCNYINDKLDGVYKSYYENRQIKLDCNFINGAFDGVYKSYYENGNLKKQSHYKNGVQVGESSSFYVDKSKFRVVNFANGKHVGVVKEYFENGNLKFLQDKNKYTFYDEDNNIKCEIHTKGYYDFIGTWKNYREDGTIEYELDFDDPNSDEKNNIVSKTIFTKGGDFFSKNNVSYEIISGSKMLYSSIDSDYRRENGIFNQPRTYKGPPGPCGSFTIDLKPIKSIEDIIKFI